MARRFRDKGWMETKSIIKSGLDSGVALEIGPGPAYLGLEWLRMTEGTKLKGLDISPDMIDIARRNTSEYGLKDRVEFIISDAKNLPFEDNEFDGVFSNGSLHEWGNPVNTFNEIYRVLKPGGRYYISDLRRDINPLLKWFMYFSSKPAEIRPGFLTSVDASYIDEEIKGILSGTKMKDAEVFKNVMGFEIIGQKN
ncbi:MAG: class I SAM-dependent methyltransferase [Acidobacteria bacterium]|nr:class I SAM-dependent methyltransferase [Acidobacteriota bacterium]